MQNKDYLNRGQSNSFLMLKLPKRLKGLWRQSNFAKKMLKQMAIKKKFSLDELIKQKELKIQKKIIKKSKP